MRRKEGKGSRQRGGHPFPFSLALLRAWMIPRSRQLQQLSNSNLADPPWFTTPHRWHRVRLRPLTNHLHCALFLEILGCATGAGKNIASHASPPPPPPPPPPPRRYLCAAQRMEGVFQPRCSFTPNQVFQCLLSLQRPLYSVSLPLLHTGFTPHTSKYRHTTSTYPHSFFVRTHASFIDCSNTLKLEDSRIYFLFVCLFVCLFRSNNYLFRF